MSVIKYGKVRIGSGILLYGMEYPKLSNLLYQKYDNSKYTNTKYDEIKSLVVHRFLLGYPVRYMHSNGELVNLQDIKECERMITSIVDYYNK